MMKPLTCGVHPTDFMIQLCAISVTIDYIRSVVIIGFRNYIHIGYRISAKSHIGATLVCVCKCVCACVCVCVCVCVCLSA